MMPKRFLVLVLTAALSVGFAGIALSTGGLIPIDPPADPGFTAVNPVPDPGTGSILEDAGDTVRLPCTSPQQDLNFPNYWAGPTLNGLPVTAVVRRCDLPTQGERGRANFVSYLYGECTPSDDQGCAVPIEIQTWPVQDRNKEMYSIGPRELQLPRTDTTFNGFPAMRTEHRLEIFYPNVTIAVFGDDPSRIDPFAQALKKGPVVLAELSAYGIAFPDGCMRDGRYCVGQPPKGPQ
ncbi:MAG: hypothetical protein ACREA0_03035 [bacterium]